MSFVKGLKANVTSTRSLCVQLLVTNQITFFPMHALGFAGAPSGVTIDALHAVPDIANVTWMTVSAGSAACRTASSVWNIFG